MGRPRGRRDSIKRHTWSSKDVEYLREIASGRTYKEIIALMSEKFGYSFTSSQIRNALRRYNIKTGLMKQSIEVFRPDAREVNDERYIRGYAQLKIAPGKWVLKHRHIYEEHFGKIKEGNYLIFLDGDKTNFDINNLMEVTRKQLMALNKYKLKYNDADLTRVGIRIGDLIMKTNEVKRNVKK